ncbi:amino acid adenylation domain-containing protein/natural product biosynthesis luciferase-like monooxygenase protein [Flavobacterium chryseum]|uniref:non-ribosomal peptide synthetase n=1 Tax=Flavobacterium sp. P3160 TaxID=2512113 RepID=UPI00106068FF|nr:non-ribosomal peptide synthetase [Flavobacterium sp. P3160]TDO73428.1 amino acid adenylation domain-containing protein/natural product biosynthesis luciferase-like monooxygenase protein [Flavobacterium sp. P3160]
MDTLQFLNYLAEENISIELSEDSLQISYATEEISTVTMQEIKKRKSEIIDFLKQDDNQENANTKKISLAPKDWDNYPLTPSQSRSWIVSQNSGDNYAYNMFKAFSFKGNLDVTALDKACHKLIVRHESLRTVFAENDHGEISQWIKSAEALNFSIKHIDFTNEDTSEQRLSSLIKEERGKPFNLKTGPIFKASLIRLDTDEWLFFIIIHHIICDSRSLNILIRDLLFFYKEEVLQINNLLPGLRLQYKDVAVWKSKRLQDLNLSKEKAYWLNQLGGELPLLQLPEDYNRPAVRKSEVGMQRRDIDAKKAKQFKAYCRNEGGTLFTGLMTLFNLLFYKYSGQKDIILGFPVYGRDFSELEDQVGFYADTIALRTRFLENDTFKELFNNVNARAFEAYEHREYPFEEIVNQLNAERDPSRNTIFDVFVILQNFNAYSLEDDFLQGGLKVNEFTKNREGYAAYDFTFNFSELQDGSLFYEIEYNLGIYLEETVKRLGDHLEYLMDQILANDAIAINRMEFVNPSERKKILDWSRNESDTILEDKSLCNNRRTLDFGLYYFGNTGTEENQYQILLEGAVYADNNGYSAIWTPERHFNEFGGPFPNPSVLGAAIAAKTQNISIRAGSVVAGLHHPIRIAEEWSVVDNISGGRAGLCFASGWNPNDFVFFPENFDNRKNILFDSIKAVRSLWRGDSVNFKGSDTIEKPFRILPKPIQKELPVWIACGGSTETYEKAGEIGAGILTGLFNGNFSELEEKIAVYRKAYKKNNHKKDGDKVVLMLHTFLDETIEKSHEKARPSMKKYLLKSLEMSGKLASEYGNDQLIESINPKTVEELLLFSVNKYLKENSLIGNIESSFSILNKAVQSGVDEIACLVDFGIDKTAVLEALPRITQLKDSFNEIKNGVSAKSNEHSIIQLFREQALLYPNNIVVSDADSSLTYEELYHKSENFARYLKLKGAKKGIIIPLCVNRSVDQLVGVLGIMLTGAAFLPIDSSFPKRRINQIIEEINPELLVSQEEHMSLFWPDIEKIDIYNFPIIEDATEAVKINAQDLAYVMFTSGSTGKPKGVMISHDALENVIRSLIQKLELDHTTKFVAVTPLIFDISLLEVLLPLGTGGQVVMTSEKEANDIYHLNKFLKNNTVSHMLTTPSRWKMLLDTGWKNTENLVVLAAGEDLDQQLKNKLVKLNGKGIWNLYGPTETTIISSLQFLEEVDIVSIGKPIDKTGLYILSEEKMLMPEGAVGELYIAGRGLALGYFNDPVLSASVFVPNTVDPEMGSLLYKTGDLAKWLPDGTLKYIGRKNSQIKIRGYRIDLKEIENVLEQYLSVKKAILLLNESREAEKELTAYLNTDEKIDFVLLREFLRSYLPDYMIPEKFVTIKEIPVTVNGKTDTKKLRLLENDKVTTQNTFFAPRNETEGELTEIWKKLLMLEEISVKDNFFFLGGNSLKLAKMKNEIYKKFDIEPTSLTLLHNLTIESFSIEIEKLLNYDDMLMRLNL